MLLTLCSEFAISNNNRQTNIAAAKERLETSRKILANLYCSLILGVKIEEFHHMKAGKFVNKLSKIKFCNLPFFLVNFRSRCSKTRADREFYDVSPPVIVYMYTDDYDDDFLTIGNTYLTGEFKNGSTCRSSSDIRS